MAPKDGLEALRPTETLLAVAFVLGSPWSTAAAASGMWNRVKGSNSACAAALVKVLVRLRDLCDSGTKQKHLRGSHLIVRERQWAQVTAWKLVLTVCMDHVSGFAAAASADTPQSSSGFFFRL